MKNDSQADDGAAELAALAEELHAGDRADVPTMEAVLAQARRDARKERFEWAYQIAGPTFAAVALVYTALRLRSPTFLVFAAVVVPVLFALLGFFMYARRAVTRSISASMVEHVGVLVERRRADLRVARAARAALALLVTAFWLWLPFFVWSRAERFSAEPWRIAVSVGIAVLVFVLAWRRAMAEVEKARAELERWTAIAGSLGGASG